MCYAEAASPRITETSICAAQQLFNSSCWAVSRLYGSPTECGFLLLGRFNNGLIGLNGFLLLGRFNNGFIGLNGCYFQWVHLSQVHQRSKRYINIARSVHLRQVHPLKLASVKICAICGRFFPSKWFCEIRGFRGSLLPSRRFCENPCNLWENILSSSNRENLWNRCLITKKNVTLH